MAVPEPHYQDKEAPLSSGSSHSKGVTQALFGVIGGVPQGSSRTPSSPSSRQG